MHDTTKEIADDFIHGQGWMSRSASPLTVMNTNKLYELSCSVSHQRNLWNYLVVFRLFFKVFHSPWKNCSLLRSNAAILDSWKGISFCAWWSSAHRAITNYSNLSLKEGSATMKGEGQSKTKGGREEGEKTGREEGLLITTITEETADRLQKDP